MWIRQISEKLTFNASFTQLAAQEQSSEVVRRTNFTRFCSYRHLTLQCTRTHNFFIQSAVKYVQNRSSFGNEAIQIFKLLHRFATGITWYKHAISYRFTNPSLQVIRHVSLHVSVTSNTNLSHALPSNRGTEANVSKYDVPGLEL